MPPLTLIILGSSLVLNLLLGLFVFFKNRKNPVNVLFFIFVLGIVGWGFTIFYLLSFGANLIIVRLTFSFAAIMLIAFLLFSIIFPERRKLKNKVVYLLSLTGIFFFVISLLDDFIVKNVSVANNFITVDFGYIYWSYVLFAPLCIISSLIILIKKYLKSNLVERLQLKYLFLGGALFLIPAVITNLLLPSLFNIWQFNGLGPSFSIFMIVATAYAIVRYRLMDIRLIIRIGTVYTILFVAISFVFVFLSSLTSQIVSGSFSLLLPSFLIAIGFIPLKNFIEAATDKFFFKKQYKFEEAVTELGRLFVKTINIDILIKNFLQKLNAYLKTNRAVIALINEDGEITITGINPDQKTKFNEESAIVRYFKKSAGLLDRDEINYSLNEKFLPAEERQEKKGLIEELNKLGFTIAGPIFIHNNLIAVLFVGEKLSGDPFFKQDKQLLEFAVYEAAYPLENARIFKRLLQLDEAKSEFITTVSHQLRSPLSASRWNTELLLEGIYGRLGNKKIKEMMEKIYGGLIKMNNDLNDLLTALEIAEKKIVFTKQKIDFAEEVAATVIKKQAAAVKKKNINLITKKENSPIWIEGDLKKLTSALDILISNAVLYSPSNSTVTLSIVKKEKMAEISVEDEGIGIKEEYREAIFEKFFRGEEAKKMSPDGLGLGLFIARSFIELHSGKLWLDKKSDAEKSGSRFIFTLPI